MNSMAEWHNVIISVKHMYSMWNYPRGNDIMVSKLQLYLV